MDGVGSGAAVGLAGVVPFVLVAVVAGLGVWLLVRAHRRTAERRERLATWTAERGWRLHQRAPWLVDRWRGEPFGRGSNRRAGDAVVGQHRGRDFCAFDYQYTVSRGTGENRSSTTYRLVVLTLRLPVPLSRLELTEQGFGHGFARALGAQDIQLESPGFNAAYVVKADSERFAYDVLHARAQELLLAGSGGGRRNLRIDGQDVVSWQDGRVEPDEVEGWLRWLGDYLDLVPRFVWQAHGYDPQEHLDDGPGEGGPPRRRGT